MTCTSVRSTTGLTVGDRWVCLKNTGCYTERQREEINKNDNWACPGCAHLNDEQKQKRYSDPLIMDSYM